jgi:predicted dehydrogenase
MTRSYALVTGLLILSVDVALHMPQSAMAQRPASTAPVRLITLDPGHFHAALVQKFMYAGVDQRVRVYAPDGDDLAEHLKRIERFNTRADQPTRWQQIAYAGPDYFERMLAEKAGNLVVISGNNRRKTEYLSRALRAGMHVLADKPMAITPADFTLLEQAFAYAEKEGLLLYDIMTERFEITTILQRALSRQRALFGELLSGSPQDPAITKVSVHHFSKVVAGAPLKRPPWFFDVRQQGEGIVDITTHLVDLIQWEAFPDQALKPSDATVLHARRWTTPLSLAQFSAVAGTQEFPDYLGSDVREGLLHVSCNGEMTYRLRGVHARVSVAWAFEAPPGGGDTHYSVMRGTRANLVIRQGAEQGYKPMLYIENAASADRASFGAAIAEAITDLQREHPGIGWRREDEAWLVTVPARYDIGHEAHFAQVTENFLSYLRAGHLPAWEVPNMLTKYATIMQAYELSRPGAP